MSEERQQGLYGELLFLGECLDSQGVGAVSHWAGSEDETHDFYFGPHAVEVKTTSALTLPRRILVPVVQKQVM